MIPESMPWRVVRRAGALYLELSDRTSLGLATPVPGGGWTLRYHRSTEHAASSLEARLRLAALAPGLHEAYLVRAQLVAELRGQRHAGGGLELVAGVTVGDQGVVVEPDVLLELLRRAAVAQDSDEMGVPDCGPRAGVVAAAIERVKTLEQLVTEAGPIIADTLRRPGGGS